MKTRLHYEDVAHVDLDTGEVICETHGVATIIDTQLSEKEIAKKQYEDSHIMDFCRGEAFVKLHPKAVKKMSKVLTMPEFTFFICLCTVVSYDDCIARTGGLGNGKILNCREIAETLGYNYSYARKIIASLTKHGLVGIFKTGTLFKDGKPTKAFFINPYVMYKGRNIHIKTEELFKDSGWKEVVCG